MIISYVTYQKNSEDKEKYLNLDYFDYESESRAWILKLITANPNYKIESLINFEIVEPSKDLINMLNTIKKILSWPTPPLFDKAKGGG